MANRSSVYRLFKDFLRGGFEGGLPPTNRLHLLDARRIAAVSETAVKTALSSGPSVIVGRGSQFFLRDRNDVFHVFLYASRDHKIRRLISKGETQDKAIELVDTTDKARAAFVQQYLGLKWPEPHLYHAMFNTEMGESCTATMLVECVQQFEAAKTGVQRSVDHDRWLRERTWNNLCSLQSEGMCSVSLLVSVNVGLPVDIEWQGKVVHTGVWKRPVAGRVMARRLNLDGDGQGDLAGHGGEHRAVMVYQLDSYRYWETHLQRHDFEYGQFGENLTVDGLGDDEVCIGDRYRIGGALFEVTQPRVTCYRVGIRMNNPQMAALLVSHKRPGFYFRVLEEGEIGAGDEIVKVADGPERVTVQEIDGLLYLPGHSLDRLQRALRIPALSAGWKGSLAALVAAEEEHKQGGNAGLKLIFDAAACVAGLSVAAGCGGRAGER